MMRIIEDITNFIFIDDTPQPSDIILLPGGSWPEPSERAAKLWRDGYAPLILPSGRYGARHGFRFPGPQTKRDVYTGDYQTEWELMRGVLIYCGVNEKAILKEDRAGERGTYDNAFYSAEVTRALGLTINRAIIVCKSFHARRCLMTYAWAYPGTEFMVCPVDVRGIGRNTWHTTPQGIEQVTSELQKCGQYFKDAIPSYLGS